jgi:hypothetical protein
VFEVLVCSLATVWLVDLLTAWLVLCPGSTGQQSGKLQVMRALGMSIDPTAPCCGRNAKSLLRRT